MSSQIAFLNASGDSGRVITTPSPPPTAVQAMVQRTVDGIFIGHFAAPPTGASGGAGRCRRDEADERVRLDELGRHGLATRGRVPRRLRQASRGPGGRARPV